MSDQQAAAAVTAAALIVMILVARAAVLHQACRGHAARAGRRTASGGDRYAPSAAAPSDAALSAVREAEDHVHRCWQRLRARTDRAE
ncbi:hypothetical protein [Streptomyces sp. NPDC001388]|uniref:hypothetical protein n=1 Tax=unclassified Streptomyces TaxID=2593676 RepID=UPI0036839772